MTSQGFFSTGLTMNLNTGAYDIVKHDQAGISHLNAVFGLVEVRPALGMTLGTTARISNP